MYYNTEHVNEKKPWWCINKILIQHSFKGFAADSEECPVTDNYRVVVSHGENGGDFLLIYESQIGPVVRVGHVGDGSCELDGFPLVLQSVALNGVQTDLPILRRRKRKLI